MLVPFAPGRLRRNSDQPTAITDVLVATSPSTYHTSDIPLGAPTCSARTRHGIWAMYPNGAGVVVVWPGGAIAGSSVEVAGWLDRLSGDRRDELDRSAARAIQQFLTDSDAEDATGWPATRARTWSRPATGYWLSGPANQPGNGGHEPSAWPGAPARPPRPLVALPGSITPDHAQPEPSPQPAPQRAA